jgi:hypothetical protein
MVPSKVQSIREGLGSLPVVVLALVLAGAGANATPPSLSINRSGEDAIDVLVAGGVVEDGWVLQDSYNAEDWRDLVVMDGTPARFLLSSAPTRTRIFRAAKKPLATRQEALTQARTRWQAASMTNYQYRSRTSVSGFLTDELTLVQDGTVREWTSLLPPAFPAFSWGDQTIGNLFDRLQSAIANDAHVVAARYHPELGYPEAAYVDQSELIADEEWGVTIVGVPSPPETARAENERRWMRAGVGAYEYDLKYESALNTWEGRIRVTGGSATVVSGPAPAQPHIVMTIDELFAYVGTALADGKISSAAYHAELGYPEFFSRDWYLTIVDGPGERFTISEFRRLGQQ